jgi:phenylpyruvate tautomerase PptA (4-oxalocrotonate tautomerase family)
MPVVVVEMENELTVEKKRQLAKDLTESFVKVGIPREKVHLILKNNPLSCWAEGGQLCSDFQIPPGA